MASNQKVLLGLYAAIYVRSPDKAGYDFWNNGFNNGTLTTHGAATKFSDRTEWLTTYPSTLADAAYVDKIYQNVLGIAGDANGRAFWTNLIANKTMSRTDFVSDFIAATLDYNSMTDITSTAVEKTAAVGAKVTIESKIAFSQAWVVSADATNPAKTGVVDGTYVAANDKSVALLSPVKDGTSLVTQLTGTATVTNKFVMGSAGNDFVVTGAGTETTAVPITPDVPITLVDSGFHFPKNFWTLVEKILEIIILLDGNSVAGTITDVSSTIKEFSNNPSYEPTSKNNPDPMTGGNGNDIFFVDNAGDKTFEAASAGIDTAIGTVSYTLGDNVEILTLVTDTSINGTGNTLDNTLTGNIADNVLDGGAGADILVGSAGNDTYIIDNIGDKVIEVASEGVDLVKTAITYTLPDNAENLTLTGNAAINGTGNALNNVITGNGADNVIDGGAGEDTFVLKSGTDVSKANLTLVNVENIAFDNAGGALTFSAAQLSAKAYNIKGSIAADSLIIKGSTDTTTIDISKLKFDATVETVTIDSGASTAAQNLVGVITLSKLNNNIISGAGNDTLNGGFENDTITGGAGNDSLSGGLGSDTFVFKTGDSGTPSATSFDTISDFQQGSDKINFTTTAPSIATGVSSSMAGKVTISAQGIATFNVIDTTLSSHINAIANTIGKLGATVVWKEAGDAYLFIDGDGTTSATPNALDVLIKLSGVATTAITIAGSDINIA